MRLRNTPRDARAAAAGTSAPRRRELPITAASCSWVPTTSRCDATRARATPFAFVSLLAAQLRDAAFRTSPFIFFADARIIFTKNPPIKKIRSRSQVKEIPFPKLELDSTTSPVVSERQKRKCDHGVILKVVTTNICGSDQHMVRGQGRTAANPIEQK